MKIIYAPLWQGGATPAKSNEYLEKHSDIVITNPDKTSKQKRNQNNFKIVYNYCKKLSKITNKYIKDEFVLTIGGDHSISLGTISGISKHHKDLNVVWIDAHGDMNDNKTSLSGNIHGMILSSLQGIGDKKLINLFQKGKKINSDCVTMFGIRDLDLKEKQIILENNVEYFSFDNIKDKGLEESVDSLISYYKNKSNKLHISIDLDVLNPEVAPGVSVPVVGGFDYFELEYTIKKLMENFNVVSADIVEYNEYYDKDYKTLNILKKLVKLFSEKF